MLSLAQFAEVGLDYCAYPLSYQPESYGRTKLADALVLGQPHDRRRVEHFFPTSWLVYLLGRGVMMCSSFSVNATGNPPCSIFSAWPDALMTLRGYRGLQKCLHLRDLALYPRDVCGLSPNPEESYLEMWGDD
jgi:hypothetical protein